MEAASPAQPAAGGIPAAPAPASVVSRPPGTAAPVPSRRRIDAVDLLRGLVMVVMMLDHTRDFVHADVLSFDPSDLERTTPALFFTRWVTHFCAPIFVFLAGTGAFFQGMRGRSKGELSRFLVSRGLWLILLELTVFRVAVWFNADFASFAAMFQVIWAIGVSMIVLAALIHLPLAAVAAFGVAMIALHNLLDGIRVQGWRGPGTPVPGLTDSLWMLLHQQGLVFPFGADGPVALVLYPLVPWIGVLAAGYAFGALYRLEAPRRQTILLRLGGTVVAGFILLRALNVYGDPSRWAVQGSAAFTVLSFLNVSKYPPSLLFLMMTLGPALLALAWFERTERGAVGRALATFGRVPLFFYLGQWLVAHGLAVFLARAAGQPLGWLFATPLERPAPNPGNLGFGLGVVYVAWVAGVLLLYLPCRWFAGVKQRRNDWWLSYL